VVMIAAYIAIGCGFIGHIACTARCASTGGRGGAQARGEDIENIEIVDVRSHGYYDRVRPEFIPPFAWTRTILKSRSPALEGEEIYLYCYVSEGSD